MVELTREVRCFWHSGNAAANRAAILNAWAGWPGTQVLAPFLVWRCSLRGPISPETDYLCNVKWVDQIVRGQFERTRDRHPPTHPPGPIGLLGDVYASVRTEVAAAGTIELTRLEMDLSPFLQFAIESREDQMVCVTHEYEFSAAHRLHHHGWSVEENQTVYGKCNNPHGHGHNYVVQVTWKLPRTAEPTLSLETWDAVVKQHVIERLDHRHLNVEVPPFDRLNPTVENIAVTIWDWLVEKFAPPLQLHNVRVYETPKTWADYCGS